MTELLRFLIAHFAYLYDDFGCRLADSKTDGFNAAVVFEVDELRLRFIRDRGQIFMDFQNKRRTPNNRWYSFGVLRQLLTGEIAGSEELDADKARFIRNHFSEFKSAFSATNAKGTEKALAGFERERGRRLFGR